jgi:Reverse transcriptase (RNA-dependent DNA polymerase)
MTIYRSLLARGYFPKELPPAFFTAQFAQYATTKAGRSTLLAYKPTGNFTECVKYSLALPGRDRRELKIPHPFSYSRIAALSAKNLGRLLEKAANSKCSMSRPVYGNSRHRAITPVLKVTNLARERAAARAGASYVLTADVSQFYPSLYTHAVGWAVDPKLRDKKHWNNTRLLGKKIDQALMDLDGKVSQGIPIGTDVSFLLAEVVLGQVDKALKLPTGRAVRWFDDYEIAFDTSHEAETTLKSLGRELSRYRLRLNPKKTRILELPRAAQEEWQEVLKVAGSGRFTAPNEMVKYFDTAFRLREIHPDVHVLLYALGILFKLPRPSQEVGRIAESCITQAVLSEPGATQKAFALLSFWHLNGYTLNRGLISRTIDQMVMRHEASGLSSDVAWALAFCLEQRLSLGSGAANALSILDDDCTAIQALHMNSLGLLPKGFTDAPIEKALRSSDLDREHWLLSYESVRLQFLAVCAPAVASNSLFSDLLTRGIGFYRTALPPYSMVIHTGGAPEWVLKAWLIKIAERKEGEASRIEKLTPIVELIEEDMPRIERDQVSPESTLSDLLDIETEDLGLPEEPTYFA